MALCAPGCSFIFYSIGDRLDGSGTVPAEKAERLQKNDEIVITTKDNMRVQGKYVELVSRPEHEYAGAYDLFLASHNQGAFPCLGDTVLLQVPDGKWLQCQFLGFGSWCLQMKDLESEDQKAFRLSEIVCATFGDTTLTDLSAWHRTFSENSFPMLYSVKTEKDGTKQVVNLEDILTIEVKRGGALKTVGLLIGTCVDLGLVYVGALGIAFSGGVL
jgi:hypothetical protein